MSLTMYYSSDSEKGIFSLISPYFPTPSDPNNTTDFCIKASITSILLLSSAVICSLSLLFAEGKLDIPAHTHSDTVIGRNYWLKFDNDKKFVACIDKETLASLESKNNTTFTEYFSNTLSCSVQLVEGEVNVELK